MALANGRRREKVEIKEGRRIAIQPSEEQVLATGITAEDERFSITAAFGLMLLLSIIALVGILFGFNPFSLSFNAAFVFLPTLGLFAWFMFGTWKNS